MQEEQQVQREYLEETESHRIIGMQPLEHETICFGVEARERNMRIVGKIGKLLILWYSVNAMRQSPTSFRIK